MIRFSFSIMIALGHLYLYRRLVRRAVRGRLSRLIAMLALVLLTWLVSVGRRQRQALPEPLGDVAGMVAYAWMGVALCLAMAVLAADLGHLAVAIWRVLRRDAGRAQVPAVSAQVAAVAVPVVDAGPGAVAAPVVDAPASPPTGKEPHGKATPTHHEKATPTHHEKATRTMGWRRSCVARSVLAVDAVDESMTESATEAGGPQDPGRRLFLASAIVAVGGSAASYGSWRAFAPPAITEVALKLPRLPRALDGLTVVQLSDVHVGHFIGRDFVEALVRQTNGLRADLVAITGDLVDGEVARIGDAVAPLRELRSRFGTYFVTGNHDYYSGDEDWTRFLERLGIAVLRNRRVSLGDAGGSIDLVGVDDWSGGRRGDKKGYDLEKAIAGRNSERAAVLLAHQPANFQVAAERGIDLQLSGHTHGGQVFPMTALIGLAQEHVAGLYRHGDAQLYVSRGCGFWGPPLRLGSPPEIVKLVLTAA